MDRFWNKVQKTRGCWEWTAAIQSDGYGSFRCGKPSSMKLAHRVAYELTVGQITKGKYLDHVCRNRKCVNPKHLREVTPRENAIYNSNGVSAICFKKTHCIRGHELTPENTRINKAGRVCRECGRAREREYKRRARAKIRATAKTKTTV